MNKIKLLSVILAICMTLSAISTVAFAEDSDVDVTAQTELYLGDGTVYVPADHALKDECWDLNTKSEGSAIYMTKGDKLSWESEMVTTSGGTHGSAWCSYWPDECGHYGEPVYNHYRYLGFSLSGDDSTLENLDAPTKVYSVDVVDETANETYGASKTRPANTMTTKDYEVVDSVTVLNYPTKVVYKQRGETKESHKRCGIINNANEYIAYDNYYYYVGGLLEVDSLCINEFPVKYNLQGGIMESGKTLPSKFLITPDSYEYKGNEPIRLGYEFNGWDNEELKYVYGSGSWIRVYKLSSKWNTIEAEAQTGSILIARWLPSTVSISLDPNGGTIYGNSTVKINYDSEKGKDTSYLDVIPDKDDGLFLGWYLGDTKITCIDDIPQSEWNSDNSYTLTAKWQDHKHSLKKTDAKAATCVTAGNTEYYTCDCGKWFEDANGDVRITDHSSVVIPAKGHPHIKRVDEVPATIYSTGIKEHYECSECGGLFDMNINEVTEFELVIPKLEATVKYGDLNGDDKINLLDLIAIRKYLAKWSVDVNTAAAADCNADGKVNLLDLILMRKYLAKWNVVLGPQK